MPNATDRPTWDEFKAQLDAAIQDIVDAQNEVNDAQNKLSRAQERLRHLSDNPPGSVPDVGGP